LAADDEYFALPGGFGLRRYHFQLSTLAHQALQLALNKLVN
jgi:hypothetical protein